MTIEEVREMLDKAEIEREAAYQAYEMACKEGVATAEIDRLHRLFHLACGYESGIHAVFMRMLSSNDRK